MSQAIVFSSQKDRPSKAIADNATTLYTHPPCLKPMYKRPPRSATHTHSPPKIQNPILKLQHKASHSHSPSP